MGDLKRRRNLQVNQEAIEGNDVNDKNGWPTPLTDPSNPLKFVVTSGSLGSQREFKAMSTDGQDKLSLTEGHSSVSGKKIEDLDIKVKVTELDSTD